LNAYPDSPLRGTVIAIIPTADRAKATVKVRVGFNEKDARILPQMGVRVAFLARSTAEESITRASRAVVVPHDAVTADGATGFVFVLSDDRVERRAVRLGARTPAGQIVLSGIDSGTRLAVGNLAALTDGARVRIEG
jgi:multidrug efflux pump subunit AcrA (membrane-fusion protein)